MLIKANVKLADLLSKAKICKEEVFFKTEEGDVLNLKSLLSALLLQSIASDNDILATGQIICMSDSDYAALSEFLER